MHRLEIFFDYACPYCLKGHGYLKELLPELDGIELVWRPCEAHPRPDRYGPHSDLCIQGFYFAVDKGLDIWPVHEAMYDAALISRVDVEDAGALAEHVGDVLDEGALSKALEDGVYKGAVASGNEYAYVQSGVVVVPSYRMDGQRLDSVENVGVTMAQLREFLGVQTERHR